MSDSDRLVELLADYMKSMRLASNTFGSGSTASESDSFWSIETQFHPNILFKIRERSIELLGELGIPATEKTVGATYEFGLINFDYGVECSGVGAGSDDTVHNTRFD